MYFSKTYSNLLEFNVDYYSYGMLMPGRHAQQSSGDYRYGFQGQESDDEVKGEGNSVNYKYRMHDPRVGRFFAVDPLTKKYPHYTPYSFSGNKVIDCIELEGAEELAVNRANPGVVYYNANNKSVPETILFTDQDVNNQTIYIFRKIVETEANLLDPRRDRANTINQRDPSCFRTNSANGDNLYFRGTNQTDPTGRNLPGVFNDAGGDLWWPNALTSTADGNCNGAVVQLFNMPMTNGATFAAADLNSNNPAMVFNVADNLGNIYYAGPPVAGFVLPPIAAGATNFVITCNGATVNDTYNIEISSNGPTAAVRNTDSTNTLNGNTRVTSTGISTGPVPSSDCSIEAGNPDTCVNDDTGGTRYKLR